MTPSDQQLAIFEWVKTGKGNLIVPARAGSGKTTSVCLATQFMTGKVLTMAFNKKAAVELTNKLSSMAVPNATAGTVHSIGFKLLYKIGKKFNVNSSKVFFITEKYCQDDDLAKARNFIAKLVGFAKQNAFGVKGQTPIEDSQAWMDIIAHHDISLDSEVDYGTLIEIAKKVLIDSNADTRTIDFDDMIYLPLFYDLCNKQYDWVIMDEAQDTNICRKLLIPRLLKDGGRVIIIGDEGQAIYAFCGAEANSMNLLKEMFNCEELPLTTCYRCGSKIIEEAQKYFPDIYAHESNGEGSVTSMTYDAFVDISSKVKLDGSVGILCRNNAPNVALAFALIKQGIGCRIEGRDIGNDLKKLVKKWKRVTNLEEFTIKLHEFFTKEFENAKYAKLAMLEDKLDTMIILIERVQSLGQNDLNSLERLIDSMFSDSSDANLPNIVTLSSIHKAKGLEWDTCYLLGMEQFVPSKYAKQDWELESEKCLSYVAVTRPKNELIYITDCPARRNREED